MQKPCRTGSKPRSCRSIFYDRFYRCCIVVPAGQCGAGELRSSQERTHDGGWEGGSVIGGGVPFLLGDVSWGTFAAVERRGVSHQAAVLRAVSAALSAAQRRPSTQILIVDAPLPQPPPSNNPTKYRNNHRIFAYFPFLLSRLRPVTYLLSFTLISPPSCSPRGRAA